MLFPQAVLDGIAAGSITLAFRRWRKPQARAGGRQRTSIGELAVDAVDRISADAISERDARQAGCASRAALLEELNRRDGDIYRIALRLAGPDARVALRARARLSVEDLAELRRILTRFDNGRHGPWTLRTLTAIRDRPATRAADLAAALGRDTKTFKIDVRKLKELGLTESLEVGYRLSPRGHSLLKAMGRHRSPARERAG